MIKLIEHRCPPGSSGTLTQFTITKVDDRSNVVAEIDVDDEDLAHLYWLIHHRLDGL